jgi:imidazolonepropionase-like amidohydrolase
MKRFQLHVAALAATFVLMILSPMAFAESIVIDGGTVHPMNGEAFVGRVVIEDGIITAVGADAAAPAGAQRIDATGSHVYPGLFDAFGSLGMTEIGAVSATDDQAEMGMYNPHLKAATAIHPSSELIPVTRETGLTHALVAPQADDDGVITGQAALVNLDGWTVEEMAIESSIAMVIYWPQIVTRRFDFATFSFKSSPFNDAKEEAEKKQNELRDWVEAAKHFKQAAAAKDSRSGASQKLSALAECLDGKQQVIILADGKRDIEAAIEFAEEFGFKMILAGGRDAWELKDVLAEKDIPVILGRTQAMPREDDDPYDRPFANAGVLRVAGVRIAFASGAGTGWGAGGPHSARTIPYEAAMATGFGLSEDDAMKALTLWPAEILGVGDRLGSLEAGKVANVIVTDGSPLAISTDVQHLIIAGREVSTGNLHRNLYEKYRARPHAATEADR